MFQAGDKVAIFGTVLEVQRTQGEQFNLRCDVDGRQVWMLSDHVQKQGGGMPIPPEIVEEVQKARASGVYPLFTSTIPNDAPYAAADIPDLTSELSDADKEQMLKDAQETGEDGVSEDDLPAVNTNRARNMKSNVAKAVTAPAEIKAILDPRTAESIETLSPYQNIEGSNE